MLYRQSRIPVPVDPDDSPEDRPPSVLPLMDPEMANRRAPTPTASSSSSHSKSDTVHNSRVDPTQLAQLPQRQFILPLYSPPDYSGLQRHNTYPEHRSMSFTVAVPPTSQDQSRPIPPFLSSQKFNECSQPPPERG